MGKDGGYRELKVYSLAEKRRAKLAGQEHAIDQRSSCVTSHDIAHMKSLLAVHCFSIPISFLARRLSYNLGFLPGNQGRIQMPVIKLCLESRVKVADL